MTTSSVVQTALGGSGSQLLKDLTNQGPATSIDSTVLGAAADMAEGDFRIETGIEPDSSLDWHQPALIHGTLYHLEALKARSSDQIEMRRKAFLAACKRIRSKATMAPQTSSTLDPTAETVGAKPDMDRGGFLKGLTDGNQRTTGGITDYSPDD